jgi:hypothetical protein
VARYVFITGGVVSSLGKGLASAALGAWDVPHGIISPSARPTKDRVQVAMAQTLARRIKLDRSRQFEYDGRAWTALAPESHARGYR